MKKSKTLLVILTSAVLASCAILPAAETAAPEDVSPAIAPQWAYNTLVWSNEGTTSGFNWQVGTGSQGWGNWEKQYYTARPWNVYSANGALIIQARKEAYGGMAYTSARGHSSYRLSGNGRVTARLKCTVGRGLWPCFWLLGSGTWPSCGEIDVAESFGQNGVRATCHWNDGGHREYGSDYSIDFSVYHVYTMERTSTAIRCYVDGVKFYEIDITPAALSELKNDMFIIVNLAVGGNRVGDPTSTTPFPAKMYIDYIRVYK